MKLQVRWGPCRFCGATGWWTPSHHIGAAPLNAHDRPQGGQCRRAILAPSMPAAPPPPAASAAGSIEPGSRS
jgi:hypothetical protein